MVCGKCKKDLTGSKELLKCSDCGTEFHVVCSRVRTLAKHSIMSAEAKASWRCDECKPTTGSQTSRSDSEDSSFMEILQNIQKELSNSVSENRINFKENRDSLAGLNQSVSSIRDTLEGVQQRMSVIESENAELKVECESLSKQNHRLFDEVDNLRNELDDMQQYSRNHNIEIKGVPLSENEDVYFILQVMARVLGIGFARADISVAHRLRKPRDVKLHPSIVAQFVSRSTRSTWLAAARKRRFKASDLAASFPKEPVFINEHLTPLNKTILGRARYLMGKAKLQSAWTREGAILVKKYEKSQTVRVRSVMEVNKVAGVPPGNIQNNLATTESENTNETPSLAK